VEKLKRMAIGTIKLKKLPSGKWEELPEKDLEIFKIRYNYKG
jgi:16S rRNA U516 pseudouridylate synthase RsuA-like enzyme